MAPATESITSEQPAAVPESASASPSAEPAGLPRTGVDGAVLVNLFGVVAVAGAGAAMLRRILKGGK